MQDKFTGRPFHVVFRTKGGGLRSVIGDLFPDGQVDWTVLDFINRDIDPNTGQSPLIRVWSYEKNKWVSFYKDRIEAYKEL
jgi:hypothetical protein